MRPNMICVGVAQLSSSHLISSHHNSPTYFTSLHCTALHSTSGPHHPLHQITNSSDLRAILSRWGVRKELTSEDRLFTPQKQTTEPASIGHRIWAMQEMRRKPGRKRQLITCCSSAAASTLEEGRKFQPATDALAS